MPAKMVSMMRLAAGCTACLALLAVTALASDEAAQQLRDPDPKVREKAVKQLGQEDNPANVSVLATAVQDSNEKVRLAVVKSLIHLGTPASLAPLSKAVQDGFPEIRLLAVDGLVNFYLPGYVDTGFGGFFRSLGNKVGGLFSDVDTAVIDADVKTDPDVIRTLAVTVNGSPGMETRVRAARALGILRAQAAVPELLKASFSNQVDLIVETLGAFQKIKDISVGPRIIFLLNYPQKSVQKAAADTLGILRTEAAIPDLQKLFQNTDDKNVRAAALDALAFIPAKEAAPLFVSDLEDKDKRLRISSALGLGRLQDPSNFGALEKAEEEEKDTGVRLALDFALVNAQLKGGKIEKMDSLTELVSNLTSRVHRGEARPYLIELARDPKVREALTTSLYSSEPDIRKNLCIVFGVSGDSASIGSLEVLLRDRDAEVANEASRAIRIIQSRSK
jgi:HEAT repeat protein